MKMEKIKIFSDQRKSIKLILTGGRPPVTDLILIWEKFKKKTEVEREIEEIEAQKVTRW